MSSFFEFTGRSKPQPLEIRQQGIASLCFPSVTHEEIDQGRVPSMRSATPALLKHFALVQDNGNGDCFILRALLASDNHGSPVRSVCPLCGSVSISLRFTCTSFTFNVNSDSLYGAVCNFIPTCIEPCQAT